MLVPSLSRVSVRLTVTVWALVAGQWWPCLAETPADSELPAGVELGEVRHHDGQWTLRWVPDHLVEAVELRAEVAR